jgi:hypothetical protein
MSRPRRARALHLLRGALVRLPRRAGRHAIALGEARNSLQPVWQELNKRLRRQHPELCAVPGAVQLWWHCQRQLHCTIALILKVFRYVRASLVVLCCRGEALLLRPLIFLSS